MVQRWVEVAPGRMVKETIWWTAEDGSELPREIEEKLPAEEWGRPVIYVPQQPDFRPHFLEEDIPDKLPPLAKAYYRTSYRPVGP